MGLSEIEMYVGWIELEIEIARAGMRHARTALAMA